MIDEYWTWMFYGYHSDELTPKSHKPIVARCDDCCKYRVLSPATYSDLCHKCSVDGKYITGDMRQRMSTRNIGKNNPMFGRTGESASHFGNFGNKSPNWKGGRPMVECCVCGTLFETSRQQGKLSHQHICSSFKCKSVFMSERMTERHEHSAYRENLSNRMKEFYSDPVNREKMSAALQGISYDDWEMFATNQGYCPAFNGACRESNRDKYDRNCFLCGLDESENISSTGKHKKLSVHHVDMDKTQGCDGHDWKLVPLCMSCHSKAHGALVMNRIVYLLNNVWNKV